MGGRVYGDHRRNETSKTTLVRHLLKMLNPSIRRSYLRLAAGKRSYCNGSEPDTRRNYQSFSSSYKTFSMASCQAEEQYSSSTRRKTWSEALEHLRCYPTSMLKHQILQLILVGQPGTLVGSTAANSLNGYPPISTLSHWMRTGRQILDFRLSAVGSKTHLFTEQPAPNRFGKRHSPNDQHTLRYRPGLRLCQRSRTISKAIVREVIADKQR